MTKNKTDFFLETHNIESSVALKKMFMNQGKGSWSERLSYLIQKMFRFGTQKSGG